MKIFVIALTLTFASALVAQQSRPQASTPSGQAQQTNPGQSQTTPPYQSQQTSPQQMPPGERPSTSANDSTGNAQVQEKIQQGWQSDSDLSSSKLNAQVSGTTVTLNGTVSSEQQHQKALQVASQNANGMKVVDHIKVQPR
jgi:osmotically-inducible protein OsmY